MSGLEVIIPIAFIAWVAFAWGHEWGRKSVPLANEKLGVWLSKAIIEVDDSHKFVGPGMTIRHVGRVSCTRHSQQHTFVVTVSRDGE